MPTADHQHRDPAEEASCSECAALRRLFASLDPGPPPADLRGSVRSAVEAEPVPAAPARPLAWASAAAAALLVGILLAPPLLERHSVPMGTQIADLAPAGAADSGEAALVVKIRKAEDGVELLWNDGDHDYVVETSPRADAWEGSRQVAVRGSAWRDAEKTPGNRLAYYRVRPQGGELR